MAHGLEKEYTVTVSSRVPQSSGAPTVTEVDELKPIGSISYADELNGEGEASLSVEPEAVPSNVAALLKDLRVNPCELNIYRSNVVVWKGPLLSCQLQGPTLTLNARGLLYYLRYMTLEADLLYTSATDQFTIGKGLVDAYQALSYGNYGIVTSGISTSGITRVRRYPYKENQNVFERLIELAEIENGFDIWVVPSTRALSFDLEKGADKTATVFADVSNILNPNVFWSVSSEDIASDAIAVGVDDEGTPGIVGTANVAATRSSWGRATGFITADDVTSAGTIQDYAQRFVDTRKEQMFVPGPSTMVVKDVEPVDFETGDIISYSIKIGNLGMVSVSRRVRSRRVTIDEIGQEDMELELV